MNKRKWSISETGLFQSHIGAIRISNITTAKLNEYHFNPTLVQLEWFKQTGTEYTPIPNFNPTLVQLESKFIAKKMEKKLQFQSHIGAIRIVIV